MSSAPSSRRVAFCWSQSPRLVKGELSPFMHSTNALKAALAVGDRISLRTASLFCSTKLSAFQQLFKSTRCSADNVGGGPATFQWCVMWPAHTSAVCLLRTCSFTSLQAVTGSHCN
jgi:hypothetical protein